MKNENSSLNYLYAYVIWSVIDNQYPRRETFRFQFPSFETIDFFFLFDVFILRPSSFSILIIIHLKSKIHTMLNDFHHFFHLRIYYLKTKTFILKLKAILIHIWSHYASFKPNGIVNFFISLVSSNTTKLNTDPLRNNKRRNWCFRFGLKNNS